MNLFTYLLACSSSLPQLPAISSSLQITDHSSCYTSPCLWNLYSVSLRQSPPILTLTHLFLCIPLYFHSHLFHSQTKFHLLHKYFLHSTQHIVKWWDDAGIEAVAWARKFCLCLYHHFALICKKQLIKRLSSDTIMHNKIPLSCCTGNHILILLNLA